VTLTGINKGEIYLASPPVAVQMALLATLAPWGGCWATKTTTHDTAWKMGRGERGHRPRRA